MRNKMLLLALLALVAVAFGDQEVQASTSLLDKIYVSVSGAAGSLSNYGTGIGWDARVGIAVKRWLDLELNYGYLPFSVQEKKQSVVYYNYKPSGIGPLSVRETFTDYLRQRQATVNTYLGAIKFKPERLRSDHLQPYLIGGAGLMTVRTVSSSAQVPSENYTRSESKLAIKGGLGITIRFLKDDGLLLQAEVSRVQGPASYLNYGLGLVVRFR